MQYRASGYNREILDEKLKLPEGYYYNYGGEFENLQSASRRLMVVIPIALVIILLLLYATVKNVKESLFVFSAISSTVLCTSRPFTLKPT